MKTVFAICLIVFVGMYSIAMATLVHPKDDGKVHLRWATDPNPARVVQTDTFDRMYPGVTASVDPNATGDSTKVIVQCATGSGPDIMDIYPESMQTMAEAGILLDLTPYAKSMGFDTSHTYPSIRKALEFNGKQYRFPCNVYANAVVFNKKIFDDHGVAYPKSGWNYNDFVRIGKELQTKPSKSGEKHIALANMGGYGFFQESLVGSGGQLFSNDGLHSALDSKAAISSLQLYYDLMYKDNVIPTPADSAAMQSQGGWGSGGLNWFSGGKAAMIIIGRWYIVQVPNFPDLKGNLGAVTLPRIGNRPSAGVAGSRAGAINAKSPHWKDALKFLQYLASPEYSRGIVQDGDAMPPDPKLAMSGKDLVNDLVPDPAFHQAFVDAIKNAQSPQYSPFIDASITSRWIGDAVQRVENKIETPDQALHNLADQIDQQIRVNLERRPDLQKKYEQVTGKPYSPDWK